MRGPDRADIIQVTDEDGWLLQTLGLGDRGYSDCLDLLSPGGKHSLTETRFHSTIRIEIGLRS